MGNTDVRDFEKSVNELQNQWNGLFSKKEDLVKVIHELDVVISGKIDQAKAFKASRDQINGQIKELKKKRDEFNAIIGPLIEKAKLFPRERTEGPNPEGLKRQIAAIHTTIETNVLSISKEKTLMKEIHQLKKQLNSITEKNAKAGEYQAVDTELKSAKQQAQKLHQEIQQLAKVSEEKHKSLMAMSSEVDGLKAKKKELQQQFSAARDEFKSADVNLNDKLKGSSVVREKVQVQARAEKKQKTRAEVKKVQRNNDFETRKKEKISEVEAKIKSGKTLTTEDLMMLQEKSDSE